MRKILNIIVGVLVALIFSSLLLCLSSINPEIATFIILFFLGIMIVALVWVVSVTIDMREKEKEEKKEKFEGKGKRK